MKKDWYLLQMSILFSLIRPKQIEINRNNMGKWNTSTTLQVSRSFEVKNETIAS